jgi:hypothetical protein
MHKSVTVRHQQRKMKHIGTNSLADSTRYKLLQIKLLYNYFWIICIPDISIFEQIKSRSLTWVSFPVEFDYQGGKWLKKSGLCRARGTAVGAEFLTDEATESLLSWAVLCGLILDVLSSRRDPSHLPNQQPVFYPAKLPLDLTPTVQQCYLKCLEG